MRTVLVGIPDVLNNTQAFRFPNIFQSLHGWMKSICIVDIQDGIFRDHDISSYSLQIGVLFSMIDGSQTVIPTLQLHQDQYLVIIPIED